MVLPLAPKARRRSSPQRRSTAVSVRERRICRVKLPPRMRSALSWSPWPMAMEARGALPEATRAAKAETMRITGMQTPRPVRARSPPMGMWPM